MAKRAAVVLGGGLDLIQTGNQFNYIPNSQVKLRLDAAYKLFAKDAVDYIVTTGKFSKRVFFDSRATGAKTEAEAGKKYLEEICGIEPRNILYENQSIDTIGNAWFAKTICIDPYNITECIIITSDFHIERSKVIFDWVFGPGYKLDYMSTPSGLNDEQKLIRKQLEDVFTGYVRTYLIGSIAPGDDFEIGNFIKTEHLGYCLTERAEALYNAELDTAAIKVGY
jgi:hypothetical protein